MQPFLDDERYGSVVLAMVMSSPALNRRKVEPIIDALAGAEPPKPVMFAMMGEDTEVAPEMIAEFRALGVPFFRSPERALRALARLAPIRRASAALPRPPSRAPPRGCRPA